MYHEIQQGSEGGWGGHETTRRRRTAAKAVIMLLDGLAFGSGGRQNTCSHTPHACERSYYYRYRFFEK